MTQHLIICQARQTGRTQKQKEYIAGMDVATGKTDSSKIIIYNKTDDKLVSPSNNTKSKKETINSLIDTYKAVFETYENPNHMWELERLKYGVPK